MIEILVVPLALALDAALGDPRSRYHPTAWVGHIIAALAPAAGRLCSARAGGVLVVAAAVAAAAAPTAALYVALGHLDYGVLGAILAAAAGAILLKTTIAVRGMERHALDVARYVERGDIKSARASLARIVKRRTADLDERGVLSGVIESIGESTTDGITGPMFYYALLGLPGAFAYRAVNTADSMIGYATPAFMDLGWFAARCDTALNYIPARLTGLVMIASAALLRNDWRGSYRTMLRDGPCTQSLNAGYPMAALAGALRTRLEKDGCYALCGGPAGPEVRHVREAISMMRLTAALFAGAVAVPLVVALYVAGWRLG